MRIKVGGMSCEHCVMAVRKALEATPGVERVVEVSLERGEAVVEGRPDPEAVVAAIEREGYRAEVLEA